MIFDYLKHFYLFDKGYTTQCWLWKGAVDTKGYGQIYKPGSGKVRRHVLQAHRVFYENFKGSIPKGMVLDHLCKIKECVNPEHLEIVTNEVNIKRGKVPKISQEIADEIRTKYSEGKTKLYLTSVFGISRSTLYAIINNQIWVR